MAEIGSKKQRRSTNESSVKWRRKDLEELDDVGLKRIYLQELPGEIFEVNWQRALGYFVLDYALLSSSSVMFIPTLRLAQTFFGPTIGFVCGISVFSIFYGLVMTSLYAIGTDCLHGIFADSPHVNEIFGRLCFIPLLIPYTSFQQRNIIHHKRINRVNQEDARGVSFLMSLLTKYTKPVPYLRKFVDVMVASIEQLFRNDMVPVGNVPNVRHRTPAMADFMARIHLENGVIMMFLALIVLVHGVQGLAVYFCCYANFGWWMYVDTYMSRLQGLKEVKMQNRKVVAINKPHEFDTQVWKFGKGVFQVHDHDYGAIVNQLRHHYNDCAGVRHILFGEVPHYNLLKAKRHILRHPTLPYGETSQHGNIFINFWRIYNALGDAAKLHELKVEGILAKPKRRQLSGVYTRFELDAIRDKRWQETVDRRKQNTKSLSFAGGWVYPDTFGMQQRRGTGLEAVSFFNPTKADKRSKGKYLGLSQLIRRQQGDDSD